MNKINLYKIGLTALASIVLLSTGTIVFAIQNPTANAGSDLHVISGQTVTLQGSGYDPNGYNITYTWYCSGGTLSNNYSLQPIYTAPYTNQYGGQHSYVCTLRVQNSYGYSSSDSTTIFVDNNNSSNAGIQTNSATNVLGYQATLNGYASNINYGYANYVWFQWGTGIGYGNETQHQSLNGNGPFSQTIANLSANTTYHFRAVAQMNNGNTVYGQDMTFYTSGSGNYYYGTGNLIVTKKAINLTSGNLNWQASVNANPNDLLSFVITLQADGQDVHNILVRDNLPANLIYTGNLTVNAGLNYNGNPQSGINVGTLPAGQVYVVAYQARIAPGINLPYGTSTINNNAIVSSAESGSQTASASVIINNPIVQGATYIPTGVTNNPITDSFFIPIALILLGSWFYFSGEAYRFAGWLSTKIG
jgi:hypothetical protein